MSGLIIEAGVYFLLFFTPFAFGGVEMWAMGVLQIVSGIVFTAWAFGDGVERGLLNTRSRHETDRKPRRLTLMWVAFGLFVLLVCLQILPLPPAVIRTLSPAGHELYSKALPGYAEGRGFDSSEMPQWLLAETQERIPGKVLEAPPLPQPEPSQAASAYPAHASAWRTISISPFLTRQSLTILLCYAGVFVATSGHFRTKERLSRLIGVAVLSGFAVSLFGFIQKLSWNGKLYWIREVGAVTPFGPFVNRNSYAAFAGTVLPVAVCIALWSLHQIREGRREALPQLLFFSFTAVTIAGGIFYSLSRGGMIEAALSVLVIAAFLLYFGRASFDLSLLGVLLLASAAFLVWLGPEQVIERAGTISQGQSTPTLAIRIVAWRQALDLVADNRVLGTGLGAFRFSFPRYEPPGRSWWTTAHNEYLELLCDTGVVGSVLILAGLAGYVIRVMRPSLFRGGSSRYAFTGVVAGIAGLLLHSVVSSNLQVPANGLMLVVLGAALHGLVVRQSSRRKKRATERSGRVEVSA